MQLKAFQDMIRANNLDEGAKPKDRLTKLKAYERRYEEYLDRTVMPMVMSEALSKDPDVLTQYYPRNDQLLVILHNKVNNAKRQSENKEKPHGLKKWKAS